MSSETAENIHEKFIRRAIELSSSAVEHGNYPFGACLVSKDGEILLTAENTTRQPNFDRTRHAELNLVSMAMQKFSLDILEQCTLYTSCESCLMCTGAFLWTGIRKLVYGLPNERLKTYLNLDHIMTCRAFLPAPHYTVIGPVLEEEAAKVHDQFPDYPNKTPNSG